MTREVKKPRYLRSPDDAAAVTWPAPRPPGRRFRRCAGTGTQSHDHQDLRGHQPDPVRLGNTIRGGACGQSGRDVVLVGESAENLSAVHELADRGCPGRPPGT